MPWLGRNWVWIVLLLAPLVVVGRAVFSPLCIGSFDEIRAMAPWFGPKPETPWDVLQADSVLQFFPWRSMVLEAWGAGQLPVWSPYSLGGTPLLANSQSAALYPLHILMGLLRLPASDAIDLAAWFHLFWAGWGVARLVRRLGGSDPGAAVAGLSFQLSPFAIAWTALPSVVSTASWIPWLMAGIVGLLDESDRRARFRSFAMTAATAGMMFLAGHLQIAAYGILGSLVLGLGLLFVRERAAPIAWGRAAVATGAVGCGMLLAAPQLLPVLEYGKFSHRRNTPTEEGYQAYVWLALAPLDVLSRLGNPMAQGNPTAIADPELGLSTFYPAAAKPGANFAEGAVTVGPLVLLGAAMAGLAGVSRRLLAAWISVAIAALLLLAGTPLNRLLYFGVPGWSSTGSPGRSMVLFVLALCVLAGLGLSRERNDERRSMIPVGLAGVILLVGILPIVPAAPAMFEPAGWYGYARDSFQASILPYAGMLAVAAAAIGIYLFRPGLPWRVAAIAAPIVLLLLAGLHDFVRIGDPTFLRERPAGVPPFARIAVENERWTFIGIPPALAPPNTLAASRTAEIGGYDSLLHRDSVLVLHEISGRDSAPEANGNLMFVKSGASLDQLAQAGVSELWAVREGAIERSPVPGPGRADVDGRPATIRAEGYDSLLVEAEGPGILTVRDRWMPGWSAWVDGSPVPLPEGRWRTLELGPGHHTVRFRYDPPGFRMGLALAALGLATLTAYGWSARKSGRADESVVQ